MSSTEKTILLENRYVMPTYGRAKIVLDRGKGTVVRDAKGKAYLDFIGGIATVPVGHAHPAVVAAIARQAKKIINVTNLYYTEPMAELAHRLVEASGMKAKVFFCNSGTEAVEGALKLARRYTWKTDIVATEHSFHGRTMGALSATWKKQYKEPFAPLVPGFSHIPFNDVASLEKSLTDRTAAFLVEPIQGEGGIRIPARDYLVRAQAACAAKKVLLAADEIQTGLGRTGRFFAFQHEDGVHPDIITLAKGLGGGVPIGAILAKNYVADAFEKGDHGSTFGGNALACAAALAVLDVIRKEKLIDHAAVMGRYFVQQLEAFVTEHAFVEDVRGKGLMIGVECSGPVAPLVDKARDLGLLVNAADGTVLRFLPPLTVSKSEIDRAIGILGEVFTWAGEKGILKSKKLRE